MPSSLLTWCKQTARYFFSNVGFIWDQQRITVGVCNNGDSHAWQRKESSYREEEKVGRVIMSRVFDFSLTEFLPGTKKSVWLLSSVVVSEHDSSLILVSKFYLILKKISQLRMLFFISQKLGNSHLFYCPLSLCPSPLLRKPTALSLFIWLLTVHLCTHIFIQQGWRFCYQIKLLFSYFICA